MIRTIYFPKDGPPQRHLSRAEWLSALDHQSGFLWVSLEDPDDAEMISVLADIFQFHPLTIEDCQSIGYQTPKIDDFGGYIFIIAQAILHQDSRLEELEMGELDIYLGKSYLVSCYRGAKIPAIEAVWGRLKRDERLHSSGPDFLCHALLDMMVDDYMPLLDQMDEEIELLEDKVLAAPQPSTLERILNLKHSIMTLWRIISPMREVVNRLSRDEYPQIDARTRIYFRDVYDHLVRIQDLSENIRDIVSGALDIYLNSTSLRLNEVMKALTIVSTVFLPLTFIAGVYGMNFLYMPELSWKYGYPLVWVMFLLVVAGMVVFFKRRGWF